MFTAEQKRYIYENSVKVNDLNKYTEIMAHYSEYFSKVKSTSIKRKLGLIFLLVIALWLTCNSLLTGQLPFNVILFRGSAILVGALIIYKLGTGVLNYIDDLPIVNKIKNKECDLLYFEGELNEVSKFINYNSTSSSLSNYFMTISGNKLQIDKETYKTLLPNKGKKIRIYYFAELLSRQLMISDATIIMVLE